MDGESYYCYPPKPLFSNILGNEGKDWRKQFLSLQNRSWRKLSDSISDKQKNIQCSKNEKMVQCMGLFCKIN